VIKYLIHDGRLLTNRLLIWDGLESHAEEICVERDPKCPVCGGFHDIPAGTTEKPIKAPARKKK
jgi:hypothetical protein